MTRKNKNKRPAGVNLEGDRAALLAAGYEVIERSPWHWHVRRNGSRFLVNIWPTAMKYMEDGAKGASRYVDVVKAIEGVFKNAEGSGKIGNVEAEAELLALRQGGLEYIRNKFKL